MNKTELVARARAAQEAAEEDFYSACDPALIGELADALEAAQLEMAWIIGYCLDPRVPAEYLSARGSNSVETLADPNKATRFSRREDGRWIAENAP